MSAPGFEILPWDTSFFGFPTARINLARIDADSLSAVLTALRQAGARLAYWSSDPADVAGNAVAQSAGGFLADEKITYAARAPFTKPAPPATGGLGTIPVTLAGTEADRKALEVLAIEAGKYSRFRVDPDFPRPLFESLYREWMRKSLDGTMADAVLIAGTNAAPQGMLSLSAGDGGGKIGLVAVAPARQGTGLGTTLMRAAEAWFAERGCAGATVVTQAMNAGACRLYEKCGYSVARRELIRHFWIPQ